MMILPRRRRVAPSWSQRSLEVCLSSYLSVFLPLPVFMHIVHRTVRMTRPLSPYLSSCLDISTETDHSDGAAFIERKGGSDLIHTTGKI